MLPYLNLSETLVEQVVAAFKHPVQYNTAALRERVQH